MSYQPLIEKWERNYKGLIWDSRDSTIYIDNPKSHINDINFENLTPIMNSKEWVNGANINNSSNDKSASINTDPLALTDVFYGPFGDLANDMLADISEAKKTKNRSLAAAVITSLDYSILQDAIAIGESVDAVKTGILAQAIPEQQIPNLKAEWFSWDDAVEFHLNVPEGQAVEPSKGTVTSVEYTVPKHQGAVAITEYARAMINAPQGSGSSIFNRLVSAMQQQRLKKENGLVAAELENTVTTITGIDFGLRAGTPPLSSNTPEALYLEFVDYFDSVNGDFNAIMSKNNVYNEALNNDYLKGYYNAVNPPGVNESSAPAPGLPGVTWYRDNAISSGTKMWVMDINRALRGFRAGVRSFQLDDVKHETTEYHTKSFYIPKIVDQDYIREVTGVTA